MAPIVDNTTAGSSSAANLLKEKHPEFSSLSSTAVSAITVNNFGEEIIDEHDNDTNNNIMIHSIDTTNNNNTNTTGSSLFLDECDNNDNNAHFIKDTTSHMDLHNTALMTSFDDIDLLSTASPRHEHFQPHQFQQDTLTNMQLIISNDEELARQLQAEEDELAHRQREIFRKKQSRSGPTRKLKKSWLDNLIGEPFPQEMRSNYTKKTVGSDKKRGGGGANGTSSGLMRAIAAKEARAAARKKKNSTVILSDRTNKIGCSKDLDHRKDNSIDESVSQLSTSISNWWSNKVDNNNNNSNNTNTSNNDTPTFIDQGSGEGYYQGDYLTTNNTQQPIQPLQRHGQGTMTYKSGHTYTGNFHNNTLHGWGIYHWADGDRQRGTWKHGLRHGPCIFHHGVSHAVEYGYYDMGRVVGEGVRLDATRTTAWKLVDGRRVGGTIEIGEAERIVQERFGCFPIPAAVRVKEEC